jgi:hypothetical protein
MSNFGKARVATRRAIMAAGVLAAASSYSAFGGIVTGTFTSPLTTGLVLSADINGGVIASNNSTTEGSNGPASSPVLSADPFGVTWSAWGGPTNTNGDGTQLPNSNASPTAAASSISKTFAGGITATLSEAGTASNYGTVSSIESLNGRDRGTPSGAANDNDMFRDFEFAGAAGSAIQSTNYLQLQVGGLAASTSYEIALYSFDTTGSHSMNWTATAPTSNLSNGGHLGYNPDPTDVFTAPADEQTITWTSGGANPAPAEFTITSSATGSLTVWGWGGNGITGSQNSDTSYLNGFQIAAVPEPTTLGLIGVAGFGLMARRRRQA